MQELWGDGGGGGSVSGRENCRVKAKARGRSGHAGAETGLDVTDGDVSKPKGPLPESDTEDAGRKM